MPDHDELFTLWFGQGAVCSFEVADGALVVRQVFEQGIDVEEMRGSVATFARHLEVLGPEEEVSLWRCLWARVGALDPAWSAWSARRWLEVQPQEQARVLAESSAAVLAWWLEEDALEALFEVRTLKFLWSVLEVRVRSCDTSDPLSPGVEVYYQDLQEELIARTEPGALVVHAPAPMLSSVLASREDVDALVDALRTRWQFRPKVWKEALLEALTHRAPDPRWLGLFDVVSAKLLSRADVFGLLMALYDASPEARMSAPLQTKLLKLLATISKSRLSRLLECLERHGRPDLLPEVVSLARGMEPTRDVAVGRARELRARLRASGRWEQASGALSVSDGGEAGRLTLAECEDGKITLHERS